MGQRPEQKLAIESAKEAFSGMVEKSKQEGAELFGAFAVGNVVDIELIEQAGSLTLMDSVLEASGGSEIGRERIRQNVATDVAERLFKAGHQTSIKLKYKDGRLEQNGVPYIDIQKNTLKNMPLNPVMSKRTQHETNNTILFERLYLEGVLDTYDVLVLSPTPVDVRTREAYNFFTDTDSLSCQYLKKTDDNELTMETAMVAGKKSPDSLRHDIPVVFTILESAGYDTENMDENDAIGAVVLIRKTDTSGVHDFVEMYDNLIGDNVFYGEEKPRQDYCKYREVCRRREEQFDDLVNQITEQLIKEANSFKKPYDAIERLDELSDQYCLAYAIDNNEINARVFGTESAQHIEFARAAKEQNDSFALNMHMKFALQTSQSGSCPLAKRLGDRLSSIEFDEDGNDTTGEQTKLKDCEFVSRQCPVCKEKNVKTKVKNGTYYHIGKSCKA